MANDPYRDPAPVERDAKVAVDRPDLGAHVLDVRWPAWWFVALTPLAFIVSLCLAALAQGPALLLEPAVVALN